MQSVGVQFSRGTRPIYTVGSYDPRTQVKGLKAGAFVFTSMLPSDTTFMKFAINRSGTPSVALNYGFLMEGTIGSTGHYTSMNFAKPNAITITGMPGAPITMDSAVVGRFPTIGTANPCAALTRATDPATTPWLFSDGGDEPVSINGTATPVGMIEVTVANNLSPFWGVGPDEHRALTPRRRAIAGRVAILHQGITHYTSLSNATAGTIAWTLKTGSGTLTMTGIQFANGQIVYDAGGDEIYEVYPWIATGISVG